MKHMQTDRRTVLLAISQLALASTLAACGGSAEQAAETAAKPVGDTDLELLASIAYDLFPFPGLPPALYVRAAENLLQANNPVVTLGMAELRSASGDLPWKELDESLRISILGLLQDSAFFAAVRAASLEVLFRSPEVFAMVGYGGSALEQGGYLNRGFDDIDWLPQE